MVPFRAPGVCGIEVDVLVARGRVRTGGPVGAGVTPSSLAVLSRPSGDANKARRKLTRVAA